MLKVANFFNRLKQRFVTAYHIAIISSQVTGAARALAYRRESARNAPAGWLEAVDDLFEAHPDMVKNSAVWPLNEATTLLNTLTGLINEYDQWAVQT